MYGEGKEYYRCHNDKKQTRIVNENEMYEIYENFGKNGAVQQMEERFFINKMEKNYIVKDGIPFLKTLLIKF